ncbi:MAG: ubiquinone/menaquinone biosynthesis C-methylase UbiE [Planctomycetota bacterium]|jgi:ubiquinone/menaquinone biosynthesis C-methylase UbiE
MNAWRKRTPLNPYWLDWKHLRDSVEAMVPHARGNLLDVGVSEGPYRELYAPHVDQYVGLEYPQAILDKQPDMWKIDNLKRLVQVFGDGARLPVLDGSIDTVLSTEVLEHVPDPRSLVTEMARVLKPGGHLLLTVPFIQPLHELPSDYYRFTPSSLRLFAEGAGLVVESITPRGNFASANGAMLSQWLTRSVGASKRQSDGSVILSPWRSVLLLPLTAMIQVGFHLASKLSNDQAVCQGYALVARRPV